jgi:hypothetical protein
VLRRVVDYQAVEHSYHARHARGDREVVGYEKDRRPFGIELNEKVQDGLASCLVQVARGLVGEHDCRVADQGTSDGNPLALPAGHLRRPDAQFVGKANPAKGFSGGLATLHQGGSRIKEPVSHVVKDALVFGQEKLLEHEANPPRPQRRQFPVRELGNVVARNADGAARGAVQSTDQVQKCCLARARRPDDPD